MSTKTPNWNLALSSQTLMSLALMSAAPMTKARRWIMERAIIHRKDWEPTMGVQLGVEDPIFRPVWKDDAGVYLRGVRGCGSSTTEKHERQRKRELEKSASTTRSIVDMFSAQSNKSRSPDKGLLPTPSSVVFPPKCSKREVKETRLESQTRAAHDLGELLRLKTVQMDRYGHVLDPKSNLHL